MTGAKTSVCCADILQLIGRYRPSQLLDQKMGKGLNNLTVAICRGRSDIKLSFLLPSPALCVAQIPFREQRVFVPLKKKTKQKEKKNLFNTLANKQVTISIMTQLLSSRSETAERWCSVQRGSNRSVQVVILQALLIDLTQSIEEADVPHSVSQPEEVGGASFLYGASS